MYIWVLGHEITNWSHLPVTVSLCHCATVGKMVSRKRYLICGLVLIPFHVPSVRSLVGLFTLGRWWSSWSPWCYPKIPWDASRELTTNEFPNSSTDLCASFHQFCSSISQIVKIYIPITVPILIPTSSDTFINSADATAIGLAVLVDAAYGFRFSICMRWG
jgi:hypothetical protein